MKEEFEKKLISLISVEMFDNKKALFDELVIWFEQKLSSEYQRGVTEIYELISAERNKVPETEANTIRGVYNYIFELIKTKGE